MDWEKNWQNSKKHLDKFWVMWYSRNIGADMETKKQYNDYCGICACPFCGEIPSESFVEYTEGCPFVKCGNEYCEAFEFIPVTLATWNSRPIESGLSIKISELEAHIAALEEAAEIEEGE